MGWTYAQKMELAKALLECNSIGDHGTRDTVMSGLPDIVRHAIRRSNADLVDVMNIVDTVLNYPNGLADLIEAVRLYEGDSIPMQEVDRIVSPLMPPPPGPTAASPPSSPSLPLRIAPADLEPLVVIVAALNDVTLGPNSRRVFVQGATLDRFLPGLDLTGPAYGFTHDLIGRLLRYGYLPDRPDYHALGALLDAVVRRPDLPPEQGRFLAGLMAKYSLVKEAGYIEKLRTQYGKSAP